MSTLSDLDNLYKTTICTLPTPDRLSYCRQQLDKLQKLLEKNSTILHEVQKELIKDMIRVTQDEIKKLEKTKT